MVQVRAFQSTTNKVIAGLAAAYLGPLWYVALMRNVWGLAALSPICAHSGPLIGHCPPCYAALALVVGGLGLAGNTLVLSRGRETTMPLTRSDDGLGARRQG
jgi:hypothetical protein